MAMTVRHGKRGAVQWQTCFEGGDSVRGSNVQNDNGEQSNSVFSAVKCWEKRREALVLLDSLAR